MAISSGNSLSPSDFNNLRNRIITECQTRRGQTVSAAAAASGSPATAAQANGLITPMRNINTSTTNFNTVSQGGKISPLTLTGALGTFESKAQVGTDSGCASGCTGLCQGCTGTCTGGCTSCSGCTGGCTSCSSCSGCSGCSGCGGCVGDCCWGCAGNESSLY